MQLYYLETRNVYTTDCRKNLKLWHFLQWQNIHFVAGVKGEKFERGHWDKHKYQKF